MGSPLDVLDVLDVLDANVVDEDDESPVELLESSAGTTHRPASPLPA
jgi:hypothetical protein